jgi:hypothetical protein
MKSTIAILVAVLGFAATVAWAGDDMPRSSGTVSQPAPAARVLGLEDDARAPRATPVPEARKARPAQPAAKRPRAATPVICACHPLESHA